MKTTLTCLFIALLWNVAATQTAEYLNSPQDWYLTSNAGRWIWWWQTCRDGQKDYNPQCTMFFTSWKPVVKELSGKRWSITFVNPNQK